MAQKLRKQDGEKVVAKKHFSDIIAARPNHLR